MQAKSTSAALATRPALSIVAEAAAGPPRYVLPDQARAIINAAQTTQHRLLLETLWQSGGRITEVLRLRSCDLDVHEGALRLVNLKQRRRANRSKMVYIDPQLVGDLRRLATDQRIPQTGYLFGARRHAGPVSRQYAHRLVTRYATAAGVFLPTTTGSAGPATARACHSAKSPSNSDTPGWTPRRSTPSWRTPSAARSPIG
jgi:integrase